MTRCNMIESMLYPPCTPLHEEGRSVRLRVGRWIAVFVSVEIFVHDVGLDPGCHAKGQSDAERDGKAGNVKEGESLSTKLGQVILPAEVRPVARGLVESVGANRDGHAPKAQLNDAVANDACRASFLYLGQHALCTCKPFSLASIGYHPLSYLLEGKSFPTAADEHPGGDCGRSDDTVNGWAALAL